jgi:hypothetical protein
MSDDRFKDKALVTCEALRPEIDRLRESGELDIQEVFYVHPGSHERPWIIEEQLPERLAEASQGDRKVLVALGTKCFFDLDNPERNIDALIESTGVDAKRVNAEDCVDMLADKNRRAEISDGRSIYWMTPGWMIEREKIFDGWDQGKVNETFPRNDAVVLLDALDYFNSLSMENPEELLEFSDWLGTGLEPAEVDLERLKALLDEAVKKFE